MNVAERLASAGEDILKKRGPEFYDGLLGDAEVLAEKHVPEDLRGHAIDAVGILRDEKVKSAALNMTGHAFTTMVDLFAEDDAEQAKLLYMQTQATTQERIDFQNNLGDHSVQLYRKRQAEWAALEEAFKRIGKIALKALAALALGALGL